MAISFETYSVKEVIGFLLLFLALWQLWVALKITRINKSNDSSELQKSQIRKLDFISRCVQGVALFVVLVFVFQGVFR